MKNTWVINAQYYIHCTTYTDRILKHNQTKNSNKSLYIALLVRFIFPYSLQLLCCRFVVKHGRADSNSNGNSSSNGNGKNRIHCLQIQLNFCDASSKQECLYSWYIFFYIRFFFIFDSTSSFEMHYALSWSGLVGFFFLSRHKGAKMPRSWNYLLGFSCDFEMRNKYYL